MSPRRRIRLGTRGSDLAVRQAASVAEQLKSRRHEVDLVEVETTGDRIDDELIHRLGKTGAFVRELDEEILAGSVDAAVHSMKDVPTEMPDELVVAGVPERGPARDVLVTPDGTALGDLPDGATVGTSSLRRGAQLLADRPDLAVHPLRGNVDTRVEKVLGPARQREHERRLEAAGELGAGDGPEAETDDEANGAGEADAFDQSVTQWFDDLAEVERRALERTVDHEYDAIVLAEAGLARSGLLHHVDHERLPTAEFVPAPGQGAIAVTAADDETVTAIREILDHPHTRVETTVERTVLEELGGGCVAPVGIYAVLQGPVVRTRVRVLDRAGETEVAETRELPVDTHPAAARALAADLRERGAAEIIDRARKLAEEEI
jgi:hydroxymethylbilane synthase